MSVALIHCVDNVNHHAPICSNGANTENSFYTDCPSVTAAAGFVQMISELDGIDVDITGFAFLLHGYHRDCGKVSFNSSSRFYLEKEADLINPPVPLETFTANLTFSIIIQYNGQLPVQAKLDDILNYRTKRFNGGTIDNDLMITNIDNDDYFNFFNKFPANYVIDRSDLNITDWESMLEYVAFYQDDNGNKKNKKLHNGIFYAHQTGYQLLEDPILRSGSLFNLNEPCDHAYCEPVINLAELKYATKIQDLENLPFWRWNQDLNAQTIILTTTKENPNE